MTTTPLTPLSPDTRVLGFLSLTGTVHRQATYRWGIGVACNDRFLSGTPMEVLVSDISCQHCMAHDLPDAWEVRLSDRRYRRGYRIVHAGVEDQQEAEQLASEVGKEAYVASVPVTAEEHEHGR